MKTDFEVEKKAQGLELFWERRRDAQAARTVGGCRVGHMGKAGTEEKESQREKCGAP